jgi:hypothetical protein
VKIDELNQSGLASIKNMNSICSHDQEGRMSTVSTKTAKIFTPIQEQKSIRWWIQTIENLAKLKSTGNRWERTTPVTDVSG